MPDSMGGGSLQSNVELATAAPAVRQAIDAKLREQLGLDHSKPSRLSVKPAAACGDQKLGPAVTSRTLESTGHNAFTNSSTRVRALLYLFPVVGSERAKPSKWAVAT